MENELDKTNERTAQEFHTLATNFCKTTLRDTRIELEEVAIESRSYLLMNPLGVKKSYTAEQQKEKKKFEDEKEELESFAEKLEGFIEDLSKIEFSNKTPIAKGYEYERLRQFKEKFDNFTKEYGYETDERLSRIELKSLDSANHNQPKQQSNRHERVEKIIRPFIKAMQNLFSGFSRIFSKHKEEKILASDQQFYVRENSYSSLSVNPAEQNLGFSKR